MELKYGEGLSALVRGSRCLNNRIHKAHFSKTNTLRVRTQDVHFIAPLNPPTPTPAAPFGTYVADPELDRYWQSNLTFPSA